MMSGLRDCRVTELLISLKNDTVVKDTGNVLLEDVACILVIKDGRLEWNE